MRCWRNGQIPDKTTSEKAVKICLKKISDDKEKIKAIHKKL